MITHAVLFVRDSFCRLFVVKALTSRLVGGGGSFVRRVVFRFFLVLGGWTRLVVSRVFVWGGRATLMARLVLLAALMSRFCLRGGGWCGAPFWVDSHKVVWAPPFCLTATKSFLFVCTTRYEAVRHGKVR